MKCVIACLCYYSAFSLILCLVPFGNHLLLCHCLSLWVLCCIALVQAKQANTLWRALTIDMFPWLSCACCSSVKELWQDTLDTLSGTWCTMAFHTRLFWNWFSVCVFAQVQCRYRGSVPSPPTKCPTTSSKCSGIACIYGAMSVSFIQ